MVHFCTGSGVACAIVHFVYLCGFMKYLISLEDKRNVHMNACFFKEEKVKTASKKGQKSKEKYEPGKNKLAKKAILSLPT